MAAPGSWMMSQPQTSGLDSADMGHSPEKTNSVVSNEEQATALHLNCQVAPPDTLATWKIC